MKCKCLGKNFIEKDTLKNSSMITEREVINRMGFSMIDLEG